MPREILIHVKLGKNDMQSAIQLNGFVEDNVVPNILTTIGILENLKQQEIAKLDERYEEKQEGSEPGPQPDGRVL